MGSIFTALPILSSCIFNGPASKGMERKARVGGGGFGPPNNFGVPPPMVEGVSVLGGYVRVGSVLR